MNNYVMEALKHYGAKDHDGVKLWDFGDSQTVMPQLDENGSYLTSSICFLYVKGEGELPRYTKFPREADGVVEFPGGWKVIAVEITMIDAVDELAKKLEKAKEKLLGRVPDVELDGARSK